MVFFTCGLTGENIKLPKVAKYLQRCPTNGLTCIGTLKKWISKKGQQSLRKVVYKRATSMGQFENRSIFDNCKKIFKTEWDCNVTFTRETYSSHKSCVTENQRYGGKDYVEKGAKGETKQKNWMAQIEEAMQNHNLSKGAQRIWPRDALFYNSRLKSEN